MTAETIAKALGGHRAGARWIACCPAHEDRKPSLSISVAKDGKVLVRCHAGCDQRDVIATLRDRGLWDTTGKIEGRFARPYQNRIAAEPDPDAQKRTEAALAIWQASQEVVGTHVETYLRSRGLGLTAPPALRFHPGIKHPSGGVWLAMVALVTNSVDAAPMAVHRTYLRHDGLGKAPVSPQKMMLGPCRGGVVRLAMPRTEIMIGEGIETSLAAMQATGKPAWAALSTSGMKSLELPPGIHDIIILADGDGPGEAAALNTALRWKREGRRVRIARPPRGKDFNDVLMDNHAPLEKSAT